MKKLSVAVVGTGFWGRNHARVFYELSETDLVAVCDINFQKAKTVAEYFGVRAYKNIEKMLKDEDVKAASVCTWSTDLAKEAVKILKSGKHVFVEKPMAADVEQAKELCEVSEKGGLLKNNRLANLSRILKVLASGLDKRSSFLENNFLENKNFTILTKIFKGARQIKHKDFKERSKIAMTIKIKATPNTNHVPFEPTVR